LFNTYCAVCHDQAGLGQGITTQYGMINPPTFLSPRLQAAPVGYLYQVITEGKGQMGSYADKIKPPDRWAVVAYVRALQRAGTATIDDLPPSMRERLRQQQEDQHGQQRQQQSTGASTQGAAGR
jgi:mono/diheme cytochrome c family protein